MRGIGAILLHLVALPSITGLNTLPSRVGFSPSIRPSWTRRYDRQTLTRRDAWYVKKSHYDELGITRTATEDEIRQAYRNAAKECHPDRDGSDAARERFDRLNIAYNAVMEPTQYQREGELPDLNDVVDVVGDGLNLVVDQVAVPLIRDAAVPLLNLTVMKSLDTARRFTLDYDWQMDDEGQRSLLGLFDSIEDSATMSAEFAQDSVDNIRTVGGAVVTVGGEFVKLAGNKVLPAVVPAMLEGGKILANAIQTLVLWGSGVDPEASPLPATNTTSAS